MDENQSLIEIGILGAGTMGTGIAQLAAGAGHQVHLYDTSSGARDRSRESIEARLQRAEEKAKISTEERQECLARIRFTANLESLAPAGLLIEAIVEDLGMKKAAFRRTERLVSGETILATNTSSLSITAIASACRHPERLLGLHFFNPAPVMPLVEVVPGLLSGTTVVDQARRIVEGWGKTTVLAKDTPGFIVNRIARPFYGEALRLLEEDAADAATIDWAMREIGGFAMGPFELMDLIGNDVNLKVTESVFEAFHYDPRFRPSFVQKRMVEAGLLGRKSGRGFYDYGKDATQPQPNRDRELGEAIVDRIVALLINEAADAVFLRIASSEDIELAMTRGVRYPRGLLQWANQIGLDVVLARMQALQEEYGEDRYRPNPLLKRMAKQNLQFNVKGVTA